jgi:hypothetical protein
LRHTNRGVAFRVLASAGVDASKVGFGMALGKTRRPGQRV